MKNVSFKTRVAVIFSIYFTVIIVGVGIIFSTLYYVVVENDMKTSLLHEVREMMEEHLVIKDNQIYYKRDVKKETISSHLRGDEFSALIFDKDLKQIGTYGIYANLEENGQLPSAIDKEGMKAVTSEGIYRFTYSNLQGNKRYLILTYPLISGTKVVGILTLSKEADSTARILNMSKNILLFILPMGILGTWLTAYVVTKNLFKPLDNILEITKKIHAENISERIKIHGNSNDEFTYLSNTLNSMLDRIDEGVSKQKNFISNASHELKTPLTQAVSSLDVTLLYLKRKKIKDATEEIDLVKQDLLNLGGKVDSLLYLSKISENSMKEKQTIDPIGLIGEIIGRYKNQMEEKNILTTFTYKGKHRLLMRKEHFEILISNLISNSLKYTKNGGNITVTLRNRKKTTDIIIEDTGFGMDKKEVEHIFDRFYRGNGEKTRQKGFGLGMAIVKEICNLNGLKIHVDSVKGKGTKVTVSGFKIV